jgi:hypothetical protein
MIGDNDYVIKFGGPVFPFVQGLLNTVKYNDGRWHLECQAAYSIADAMLKVRGE